nr:MAG TPA: putative head-tail adaptor [Caudoviricetes sp.]
MSRRILKDKRIEVLCEVKGRDSAGFDMKGYMPITDTPDGKQWAYFRALGGSLYWAAAATQVKADIMAVVAYSDWLAAMRWLEKIYIRFNGRLYRATRVDTYEGYKRDLTIYAQLVNTTDAASIDILAYDADTLAKALR